MSSLSDLDTRPAPAAACMSVVVFLACSLAHAQTGAPADSPARYNYRAEHDPDGSGKFYMGREIAQVMGHTGAEWLERPERDAEEHTTILVDQLKLKPGMIVADIGAGSGYFTRRMATCVLPGGKVLAVDIQPGMLRILTNTLAQAGITNVAPVLGTDRNPNLPLNSVDVALMVDVYHEFEFPYEMLEAICQSLKPKGRLVFVEYRGEDPSVPIKPVHKMTEAQVKKEVLVHSLTWAETIRVLPRQHIIVFQKRG